MARRRPTPAPQPSASPGGADLSWWFYAAAAALLALEWARLGARCDEPSACSRRGCCWLLLRSSRWSCSPAGAATAWRRRAARARGGRRSCSCWRAPTCGDRGPRAAPASCSPSTCRRASRAPGSTPPRAHAAAIAARPPAARRRGGGRVRAAGARRAPPRRHGRRPPAALVAARGRAAGLDPDASDLAAALRARRPALSRTARSRRSCSSATGRRRAAARSPRRRCRAAGAGLPGEPSTPTELPRAVIRRILAPVRGARSRHGAARGGGREPMPRAGRGDAGDRRRRRGAARGRRHAAAGPDPRGPALSRARTPAGTRSTRRCGCRRTDPPLPGAVRLALEVTGAPHVLVASERGSSVVATALADAGMRRRAASHPPRSRTRVAGLGRGDVVVLDDVGRGATCRRRRSPRWHAGWRAAAPSSSPAVRISSAIPGWADSAARARCCRWSCCRRRPSRRSASRSRSSSSSTARTAWASRSAPTRAARARRWSTRGGRRWRCSTSSARATSSARSPSTRSPTSWDRCVPVADGPATRSRTHPRAAPRRRNRLQGGARHRAPRPRRCGLGRVRHIILLTDGDTNRRSDDHLDLIAALGARRHHRHRHPHRPATPVISSCSSRSPRDTGGEFHHVADATALPQLMIRDTRRLIDAPGSLVNAPARVGELGPMLAGLDRGRASRASRAGRRRASSDDAELRLYLDAGSRRDPAARHLAVRARARRGRCRSTSSPARRSGPAGRASASSGPSSSCGRCRQPAEAASRPARRRHRPAASCAPSGRTVRCSASSRRRPAARSIRRRRRCSPRGPASSTRARRSRRSWSRS